MNKEDLKIEFRAVTYGEDTVKHVLQYRISPNQDLMYVKEVSLFSIIKFKIKKKYSTKWNDVRYFRYTYRGYLHDIDWEEHYHPIFIDNQYELESYKNCYKNLGSWTRYIKEMENREKKRYTRDRERYLKDYGTWY